MHPYEGEKRPDSWLPPRRDRYQYYRFDALDHPQGVLLTHQIQAQSYLDARFVRPEAIVTLPGGERVLSPDIANPSAAIDPKWRRTEYVLGIERGTSDLDPRTGSMVAWRKYHAPLDELPTYRFYRDHLWQEGEEYLRLVNENPALTIVEPEGLGKTTHAGPGAIKEFMRDELQSNLGSGQILLMGLVGKAAFRAFTHWFGPVAVKQLGEPKRLEHPYIYPDVTLVPTAMDVDNVYGDMMGSIIAESARDERRLHNFVYMTNGLSNAALGSEVAGFRAWAQERTGNKGDE